MDKATEFFTFASILALGGASLGALVVTNTFRKLVPRLSPLIVCFMISGLICFIGAWQLGKLAQPADFLIAFINSCLLFCTTTGMQEFSTGAAKPKPVGRAKPHGAERRPWLSSWVQ